MLTLPSPLQHLAHQGWTKHLWLVKDTQVAVDPQLRHCPKPDCDGAARLSAADLALLTAPTPGRFSIRRAGVYVEAACGSCGHRFCAKCSAPPHPKDTCEGAGDAGFLRWKKTRAVEPCPTCGYQTEKRGGCSHMCCAKCRTHWYVSPCIDSRLAFGGPSHRRYLALTLSSSLIHLRCWGCRRLMRSCNC